LYLNIKSLRLPKDIVELKDFFVTAWQQFESKSALGFNRHNGAPFFIFTVFAV